MHCTEPSRAPGGVAELLAELQDEHIQRPSAGVEAGLAQDLDEFGLGDDLAGPPGQGREQHELGAGEHQAVPRQAGLAAGRVQAERTHDEEVQIDLCADRKRSRPGRPEPGLHPSHQHGGIERLEDEVLGAVREALGLLARHDPPGQDDDRHVAAGPDLPEHVHAVDVGQAEVENDQVGALADDALHGREAAVLDLDVALAAVGHQLGQVGGHDRVVLDDQDAVPRCLAGRCLTVHPSSPGPPG